MTSIVAVTHSGRFHPDDVFAGAILRLCMPKVAIVRTRDPNVIASADIVFDVGMTYDKSALRFDHHQPDAPKRSDGTPYSAAGLVWDSLGRDAIAAVEPRLTSSQIDAVFDQIDHELIRAIDRTDNGLPHGERSDLTHVLYVLNPLPGRGGEAAQDAAYLKAVDMVLSLLEGKISHLGFETRSRDEIAAIVATQGHPAVLVLEENLPWEAFVDEQFMENTLYVVTPGSRQQWGVTAVPPHKGSFAQRKPLPAHWTGKEHDELAAATGVPDAVFCHKSPFFCCARSKKGAIVLANAAARA